MKKIRIGVLSPSEIATRRFLPALPDEVEFIGIAVASKDEWFGDISEDSFNKINQSELTKAEIIQQKHGGKIYNCYTSLLSSGDIDAIYIPLPPALHYFWGKKALNYGLHVLLEKPLTVSFEDTKELVAIAREKNLLIYENFAFEFHKQIDRIKEIMHSDLLGEIRQIRASFGFPYRGANDFRYKKILGGGAVNDCGGYPIKLATILLGNDVQVKYSQLYSSRNHDVDTYGFAVIENKNGPPAIVSFGMDNAYTCELEIWGNKNKLLAPRVFTPPVDFQSKLIISGEKGQEIIIDKDDYFKNSIKRFVDYINKDKSTIYQEILLQDELMEQIRRNTIYE